MRFPFSSRSHRKSGTHRTRNFPVRDQVIRVSVSHIYYRLTIFFGTLHREIVELYSSLSNIQKLSKLGLRVIKRVDSIRFNVVIFCALNMLTNYKYSQHHPRLYLCITHSSYYKGRKVHFNKCEAERDLDCTPLYAYCTVDGAQINVYKLS